jgi:hypothetical protein
MPATPSLLHQHFSNCCAAALSALLQVTELKGNIRVLARIRPMSEKEHSSSGSEAAVRVIDEETVSVAGATVREYEFDRVFGPADGQAKVGSCAFVSWVGNAWNWDAVHNSAHIHPEPATF